MSGDFLTDDLTDFMLEEEFAVEVTGLEGTSNEFTFYAIFDDAQVIEDMATGQYIKADPQLVCRSADVSNFDKGDTLIVDSITYIVREKMDDGTGVTILRVSLN